MVFYFLQEFHPSRPQISNQYAYGIYCPPNTATLKQHRKQNRLGLNHINNIKPINAKSLNLAVQYTIRLYGEIL